MENRFISLKDACDYSKKSMSSIRRLVIKLKENEPERLKYEKLKNGSHKILVDSEYLNEYYELTKKKEDTQTNNTNNSIDTSNNKNIIEVYENVIKMLNNDLEVKNKQIETLLENNRDTQRELNTIINNMTNKLSLETKEVNEVRRKWWERKK
jgi:hypothetical protein